MNTPKLSRRSFLTLGGATAVGGMLAMAGCAPQNMEKQEEGPLPQNEPAALKKADETKECDVAVVGAGGAGMWAAVEAARAGKSVIVIEKGSNLGTSNASRAGGSFIVGSKKQREAGVTLTVEEAFKHVMDWSHWSVNAAATKEAISLSGETVDLFTDMFGVPYNLRPDNYGAGHPSVRSNFRADAGVPDSVVAGEDRFKPLQTWIEEQGENEFLFESAGKSLIMEDDACVVVQCEGAGIIDVKAKAVIIATGGFLGNQDRIKEKYGTKVVPLGNLLSTGEGIDMVLAAGGQESTQWGIAGYEFGANNELSSEKMDMGYAPLNIGSHGPLMVNNQGRRFANEGEYANLPLAVGGAISLSAGHFYAIVDQGYLDALDSGIDAWTLLGSDEENWRTGYMTIKDRPLANVMENIEKAMGEGWIFRCDTIEELAETIGTPDLAQTLAEYNGYCATGVDEQFYKASCFLREIKDGPFYAFQYEPSAWVTIGGVRTNDHMQAVDTDGNAIPGLFVAGADNGTLMNAPYCNYEGYSLMCAFSGGRMAGKYAAASL